MQNTFFATDTDLLHIVKWFLEVPGMTLFEPVSRPGQPNRQFFTVEDVVEHFLEPGRCINAWLETTGACPYSCYNESSTRTELRSPAAIGISRDNAQNGALAKAHVRCWNEKGAKQRSIYADDFLEQVNWRALRSIMGHFKRKVGKISPAKLGSHPIMDDAFTQLKEGRILLWGWGEAVSYPSPEIKVI